MPNLVGIGNSQVPTNAMLGGLAYKDSVGEIDIDKIKAKTGDTAADVFVYDTRKDSDGGAWRHRTQNTSWYNEGASETRGARKEFPAVAVIVVEDGATYQPVITIYDGDDPNLPMWMVFKTRNAAGGNDQRTSKSYYAAGPYPIRKVVMLNGIMVDCQYRSAGHAAGTVKGVTRYNFIDDSSTMITDEGDFKRDGNLGDERNSERTYTKISTTDIVHTQCNDVAMTVLSNAPIDASTGLPVPTIAVATDGGTNVINHDGTVTEGYQTIATEHVDLHPDGFMTDGISGATNDSFSFYKIGTIDRLVSYGHRTNTQDINTFLNEGTGECLFEESSNKIAIAQSQGLLRIAEEIDIERTSDAVTRGLHNRTTSSYNTGWMTAKNKGAFLSSTDTTNLDRTNVVTNGAFDSGTGWSLLDAAAPTISGGKLVFDGTSGVGLAQQAVSPAVITSGLSYTVKFTVSDYSSGTVYARVGNSSYGSGVTANGTYYQSFVAGGTPTETVLFYGNSFNGKVDDVEVYIEDQDRSSYNKGLQVYGTIEKHAVATGAELVSYRPNNSSQGDNYFYRPLTSSEFDLTADWNISFWARNHNPGVANDYSGFEISPNDISGNSAYSLIPISMYVASNGLIGLRGAGFNGLDATYNPLSVQDVWRCFNIVHRGGRVYLYIDAKRDGDKAAGFANPSTAYALTIFRWTYSSTRYSGRRHIDFSLFKLSQTAPSEDQIKKMYDDEKHLFKENAKCTFYGTSNAVVSLAHDDTSNILHVGTSAGRSEFRGLNRINNTTTAVTTAISASNGLVAEQ